MTRLKQAWLALCGKLEPEVREVVREVEKPVEKVVHLLGEPESVTLYEAVSKGPNKYQLPNSFAARLYRPNWDGRLFQTCEQAFAECPGAEVRKRTFYRIGKNYYTQPRVEVVKVTVQPKPKIAKGKRRNGE